jgi:hypothetical protein
MDQSSTSSTITFLSNLFYATRIGFIIVVAKIAAYYLPFKEEQCGNSEGVRRSVTVPT